MGTKWLAIRSNFVAKLAALVPPPHKPSCSASPAHLKLHSFAQCCHAHDPSAFARPSGPLVSELRAKIVDTRLVPAAS